MMTGTKSKTVPTIDMPFSSTWAETLGVVHIGKDGVRD